ncbi:MAG: CDP-diacylglycerol--serine O-phosphatidyltransferase [Bdellovibrionales bacterium]|nr:CDP-diacylglycerol--serine O-phosphatidyltransferase [Bdellovibrionales bacterium]
MSDVSSKKQKFKRIRHGSRRIRQRLGVHIYVLPNLLTTGNMFCGFFAIIYAIKGGTENFTLAAYAIVAASVFDLLDGRVARLTHSTSQFGAEYDSLSDLISFGLAPSLLLFLWALEPFGRVGWLASFFYVACGALRLARFNVQKEIVDSSYFQGLPIPMAAGIVASSVLAFKDLGWDGERSWILLAITFLLGITMVSNFPYRSFKDVDFRQRLPFSYLVGGVFLLSVIAMHPEVMLFATFLSYASLGALYGVFGFGKKRIRHPHIQVIEDGDDLHEYLDSDYLFESDDEEETGV